MRSRRTMRTLVAVSAVALLAVAPAAAARGGGNGKGMSPNVSARPMSINRTNESIAFSFFLERGLTAAQAAGVIGNLDVESGMDPTIHQIGGGPGRGIAQWSAGGRWDTDHNDNVLWYADAHDESSTSLILQLQFIWYELSTFSGYGLSSLRAASSVNGATVVFQDDFEGCGECNTDVRESYAAAAYNSYHGAVHSGGSAVYTGSDYVGFWTRPSNGHVMQTYWNGSWHTVDLGGVVSGPPAVTYHSGRYDLFAVSPGGRLYHKYYSGHWSSWGAVAGTSGWRGGVSSLWTGSQYHAFGHNTANHLVHVYWDGSWHVSDLGGVTVGTPGSMYHDGRYDVFSVAPSNHHIYHRIFEDGSWSGWVQSAISGSYGSLGIAGAWTGASYRLFSMSSGNHLYSAYYEGGWHGPYAQDGTFTGSAGVSYHDGRYDLFGPAGGGLYHKYYTPFGGWSGWNKVA